VYQDFTVYGGSYTARNQVALFLFVTRTDKNGVRTPQSVTPGDVNPLTIYTWAVTSTDDGWLEKILFTVNIWNSGTAYVVGDIIFNTADGNLYKCILNHTNHVPPNGTYWVSIPSASLYTNELANVSTQMVITIGNDLNTCRIEDKMRLEYQRIADNFLSTLNSNQDFTEGDNMDSLLNSAYAALKNNRPQEAEEIIRDLTNYQVNYGALN
jgi:hypothetical protein